MVVKFYLEIIDFVDRLHLLIQLYRFPTEQNDKKYICVSQENSFKNNDYLQCSIY